MSVAAKFKVPAEIAYGELVRLSKSHGGVTASIMSRTDSFVPAAMTGEFVITGADKVHTATNLASAIVTLKSVHNTRTVWLVRNGKRTKVIWK